MREIIVRSSRKREVIDITAKLNEIVKNNKEGVISVFLTHTSAALATANLDTGTDLDLLDAIDAIIPKLAYRHPHKPGHAVDHITSSVIGTSLNLLVRNGALFLGTWQSVVLIELDGPRDRRIVSYFNGKK